MTALGEASNMNIASSHHSLSPARHTRNEPRETREEKRSRATHEDGQERNETKAEDELR
jgi:hypothetical protein